MNSTSERCYRYRILLYIGGFLIIVIVYYIFWGVSLIVSYSILYPQTGSTYKDEQSASDVEFWFVGLARRQCRISHPSTNIIKELFKLVL